MFAEPRFEEDPLVFSEDNLLGIKFIPMNKDASIYTGMGGQIRVRYERWDDMRFNSEFDDDFWMTRTRIHSDTRFGEHFRVFLEAKSALIDARSLPGGIRPADKDTLDLQNGFAEFNLPFGTLNPLTQVRKLDGILPIESTAAAINQVLPVGKTLDAIGSMMPVDGEDSFSLRAGRQELALGSQRLVSYDDWSNSRRTFDGLRGTVRKGFWILDGFATRPVEVDATEFNESDSDSSFFGTFFTRSSMDYKKVADLYWFLLDQEDTYFAGVTGDQSVHTGGGRVDWTCPRTGIQIELEGARQWGDLGASGVNAYFFASEIRTPSDWLPGGVQVFVGYDIASGDSNPGQGDVATFNQLFPDGHRYYGQYDMVGRQNAIDFFQAIAFRPAKKVKIEGSVHWLSRTENEDSVYYPDGTITFPGDAGTAREIGQELDLLVTWSPTRYVDLHLGAVHFIPGDFAKQASDGTDSDFVYASTTLTF